MPGWTYLIRSLEMVDAFPVYPFAFPKRFHEKTDTNLDDGGGCYGNRPGSEATKCGFGDYR